MTFQLVRKDSLPPEILMNREYVEEHHALNPLGNGPTACRIKLLGKNGKECWFDVTILVRNGRPAAELTTISKTKISKRISGTWTG